MNPFIKVTKAAYRRGSLVYIPGYVSNGHFLIPKSLVTNPESFESVEALRKAWGDSDDDVTEIPAEKAEQMLKRPHPKRYTLLPQTPEAQDGKYVEYKSGAKATAVQAVYARMFGTPETLWGTGPEDPLYFVQDGQVVAVIMPDRR